MMRNYFSEKEIFARTLYGEARGEVGKFGDVALKAVASIIINRFEEQAWYGKTIKAVCLKKWQFSCWNDSDPNLSIVLAPEIKCPIFDLCLRVADLFLQKNAFILDVTSGANHYHHRSTFPLWAVKKRPTCQIGNHIFYKL
jgi:N-acetylmuramoyl-L-alanine amidase